MDIVAISSDDRTDARELWQDVDKGRYWVRSVTIICRETGLVQSTYANDGES